MSRRPSQERLHSVEANVGTLAMAGGAVAAINEVEKAVEGNSLKHGIHAGIGAAAMAVGYEMVQDAQRNDQRDLPADCDLPCKHQRRHRSTSMCSDRSREPRHHLLHLAEEAAGAWAATKSVMGDKDHKKLHLVEEVLGAVGLYKDAKERSKES
ncbi:hypothetical protein GP486_002492 [Trichoglossum hirsutum]|uniref:Uncharacterized protein n=1 Tax=Trichoglossum hirsutum TaxID=265104 RepID=A0A9P8LEW8_9PEZI|nr:hypothetical protein GP486_002492 [Trichoglossum hirsutum]